MDDATLPEHIASFIAGRGDGTAVEYFDGRDAFFVWKPRPPAVDRGRQPFAPALTAEEERRGTLHVYRNGNWSCDCNRRDDIKRAGFDVCEVDLADECGDTILILWLVAVIDGESSLLMRPGDDKAGSITAGGLKN